MRIIAGDIGGTKVLLQLVDVSGGGRVVTVEQRYESAAFETFDALLGEFMNLAAGTGLGEANLVFEGGRWIVVPGEGGHAEFAPQDEEQARLFLALHAKLGHVSWERVLSGMGLVNIHNFLAGVDRPYDERIPMELAQLAEQGDATATHAFEIFVDV